MELQADLICGCSRWIYKQIRYVDVADGTTSRLVMWMWPMELQADLICGCSRCNYKQIKYVDVADGTTSRLDMWM